jgi:hypothetical protein
MSTSPALVALRPTQPAAGTTGQARAGLAMSLATFAMALASAMQAVLYLSRFGVNGRTDGFFVAFALYSTFGVFSQSLRLTSVPLLVQPGALLSGREFAAVLGIITLPVLLVLGPLAGPTAHLLAPGLSVTDRAVTQSALPILGGAMVLQLWAAGAATLLAIRTRFSVIAGAYIGGATAGLAAYLALESSAGELTLGWSMLAMAAVTSTWMLLGLRASGGLGGTVRPSLRRALVSTGLVLRRTSIYLAFNALFVITLSAASHSSAGDTTVLSYAYLFASYLVAGTSTALGMSRISEMTRGARVEQRAVLAETVPQGFRYSMLLVAPAMAGLVTAGAPIIHALFPHSLDAAGVHSLRLFATLMAPWTIAALLVNFLMPALFAMGRSRLLNGLALPLLAVHAMATLVGNQLAGLTGAVAAMTVAPALFAGILLVAGAGMGPRLRGMLAELSIDTLRPAALAVGAFGIGWSVGAAIGDDLSGAAAAAVIGTAIFASGMLVVFRRQVTVVLGAMRGTA